jgi:hypothetical protein
MVATEHANGGGSKGHGLQRRGGQGAWVKGRVVGVGVVLGEGWGGGLGTVSWRAKVSQHTQVTLGPWHHATGATLSK